MSGRMTPGERIKQARKNAKLTQEEVGRLVDVTGVSIMRYEKGERVPDYTTTCRLASALKLKIEDLMSETAKEWYDVGYETGYEFGYEEALVNDEQNYFMIDKRCKQKEIPRSDAEILLINFLSRLNSDGQREAVKRVEELTEIQRYRTSDAPKSTPAPTAGKDVTPPSDAPETPPEGK